MPATSKTAKKRKASAGKKKAPKASKAKPTKKSGAGKSKTAPAAKPKRSSKSKTAPAAKPRRSSKSPTAPKTARKPAPARKKTARPSRKGKSSAKISAADRRKFRGLLLGHRARIGDQISSLKQGSLRRDDWVNSEEDGTDAFDRQFALGLVSAEHEVVFEIDLALRKLEEKTYGICESCSCSIERPRLEALPFVRYCVQCQLAREKAGGRARRVLV